MFDVRMTIIRIMFVNKDITDVIFTSITFARNRYSFSILEEKSKMSQPIRGQRGHLVFRSARKTQTWLRTLRSCFLSSFIELRSVVSEEKLKMSQPIRGNGGHLVFFSIRPKITNLVEDIEILLPVKYRWILFSGFRGKVKNV